MGPFIRSKDNVTKIIKRLLISLLSIIIFSFYKNGILPFINNEVGILGLFYPLIFVFVGIISSVIFELIYLFIFKKSNYKEYIKESNCIFQGLFLSLILPLNTPIYILILGTFISIISNIILDEFGKNIFNPTLIGYLFIMIIFSSLLPNSYKPLTSTNLLSNNEILNMFIYNNTSIISEISALLCFISFIYLTVTNTIKWRISISYILTVFIITYVIGSYIDQSIYYTLFHILNGRLIFSSIYIATDSLTSTVTPIGQILQGIFLGIITMIFRLIGIDGVLFSILIMNLFVPLLDKVGSVSRFNIIKSFSLFFIAWIIIILLCLSFSIINK